MRLARLDLLAFGPFTNATLDLSAGAEGLHLIYGPNEAGKSSALRAIQQLFSGIPTQSTDDFVHKYSEMRIGARLRDRAGESLEIVRRKGLKNTLLDGDGKPIDDPDARLARWLGGITADDFLKKFVIDHAELVGGGKSVTEGKGDLGRVLFAAGSGLAGLAGVQKRLDDEAEALFKKGGSKPLINLKLAELEATRKRLKDETLRSSEWRTHDEAYRAALARKETLDHDRSNAARQRDHLQRLAEALDPIARRSTVLAELGDLADVPRLSPDFSFRRRDAESRIGPNERFATEAEAKIGELTEALANLDVPAPLLEQAETIKALHLRLGTQTKAETDRIRLEAERARFEAEARLILRDLGRDDIQSIEPKTLESLRLKSADRAAVHDLANARQALLQARDDAANALQTHDAKTQALAVKVAALGPGRDTDPLRKAVKRAQKAGDLETPLKSEHDALKRDRRKLEAAAKALGHWSGPVDSLEALPIPSNETIEQFQQDFDKLESESSLLQRQLDEREAESRAKTEEIERLQLEGDVPTEDALTAARSARDALWDRLKANWDARQAPTYEHAVRQADEAADRLRREAKRVGDHARLRLDLTRLAARLDDLRARQTEARSRRDALQGRLGRPLAAARNPRPRHSSRDARLDPQGRRPDRPRRQGPRPGRDRRPARSPDRPAPRRDHRGPGHVSLIEPPHPSCPRRGGEEPSDSPVVRGRVLSETHAETLADLIERAQDLIDAVAKESKTRERLRDDLDALKAERPAREAAAAATLAAWDHWQARWADAMTRIGRDPSTLPSMANVVLDQTVALFDRLDRSSNHAVQIEAITREANQFKTDAWRLADRVAGDLATGDFDAGSAVAELAERLARAQRARQSRDNLTARLAEERKSRDGARAEIAKAQAELALLRREARCESDDALPAVEERFARRQALEKALSELNATLHKLAAGVALERFLAEAGQTDISSLSPRIARLDERLSEFAQERETIHQTIGQERTHLELMNGSARAADTGQDAEDLRARIKADVEQYARLRLASAVLRAGIERYRDKSQEPVLDRASALFATLTLGSFEGLKVDYNDSDEPVLKGVRPGRSEPLGVDAMSLGTADQLYLALRLATLETYLARREPLPLIVDDILIQFDNPRAAATLSVLADLARRTQVLVFTHHEHLRDLAVKVVSNDLLFTHELPGRVAAIS